MSCVPNLFLIANVSCVKPVRHTDISELESYSTRGHKLSRFQKVIWITFKKQSRLQRAHGARPHLVMTRKGTRICYGASAPSPQAPLNKTRIYRNLDCIYFNTLKQLIIST